MQKFIKIVIVALVLSIPGLVMAESTTTAPTKAPEVAKGTTTTASTGTTTTTTTTPTTIAKTTETTATTTKVAPMPEMKTVEGTISNINTTKNTFTLKDNTGTSVDLAYNLTNTLKAGEKVKVHAKKDGMNWTATNLEKITK